MEDRVYSTFIAFTVVFSQGLESCVRLTWYALYMYGFNLDKYASLNSFVWPRTGCGPRELSLSTFVGNGRKPLPGTASDSSHSYDLCREI